MSKSRKKLESLRKATKERRDKPLRPEPWTWKDKLGVCGILAAVMLLTLIPFVDQTIKYRQVIDRHVARWKAEYHLTEQQAQKIREIELEYHKAGLPLSASPKHTPIEDEAHRNAITSFLDLENARRFLKQEAAHGGGH